MSFEKVEIGDAVLYRGDCLEVMRTFADKSVDAVITDPPYGINLKTNYAERGRGNLARCNNFPPIHGDDKAFDPTPFLGFKKVAIFGGNNFPQRLQPASGWLIWDKVDGLPSKRDIGFCDQSDAELIYTNFMKVTRVLHHRWMGMIKDSERDELRVHPTQKPIELMQQIILLATKGGESVFDPFMGSGTTGVACAKLGRKFIGVEISQQYFDIACKRIEAAQAQLRMEI